MSSEQRISAEDTDKKFLKHEWFQEKPAVTGFPRILGIHRSLLFKQ